MRLKKWLASFVGPLADSGRTVRDGKRALRYRRLSLRCEQLETRIAPAAVALQDPNGTQFDYFGNSVALSGSTVLVGAGGVNGYSGAAYLYGSSGQLLQTFQDPGGASGDTFGISVALSGANVLVGAKGVNNASGAAYLYNSSGQLLETFQDPGGTEGDIFGMSVALSGSNVLVVGADGLNGYAGAAYLYNTSGQLLQTFHDPNGSANDNFGLSVALSGSDVLVGAYGVNGYAGAAYLYNTSGQLLQTFHDPGGAANDDFGSSVAISGSNVLIGAVGVNGYLGAAYLYNTSGQLLQTFAGPGSPANLQEFGGAVALSGTNVLVGAYGANGYAGAAYLFNTSGQLLRTYQDPTATASDAFGGAVALSGANVLVGADGVNSLSGAAYDYPNISTWSGDSTTNNLWSDADNWVGDQAPLPGADLVFPAGAQQMSSQNDLSLSFNSITVQGGSYTFAGNSLTVNQLTVQQGSLELAASATVSGTLEVQQGATLSVDAGAMLSDQGDATVAGALQLAGNLEITSGGSLDDQGTLSIAASTGALTIDAGGSLDVSGNAEVFGTLTEDAGSALVVFGALDIEQGGGLDALSTILNAPSGSFTIDGTATIGSGSSLGSFGTLTVDASGLLDIYGRVTVEPGSAYSPIGTVIVEPGGSLILPNTPGLSTPSFSGLSAPTILVGTNTTTISGELEGGVPAGESVQITLGGVTQSATLDGSGHFSATFATAALDVADSPYTLTFSYSGDADFFGAIANTTLTVVNQFTTALSSLSAPVITFGTATTAISGQLGSNATGQTIPSGETVQVTLDGVTEDAVLDDNDDFTATFDTHALAVSAPYSIAYSYAGDGTFSSTSGTSTLTVNPATLTITPQAGQSMVYGAAVPVLAYTASGFASGDSASLLTGLLGTTAASGSAVGSYSFTLGSLSAGPNYTLSLSASPPTFAVTPATLTITPTTGQSMVYGSTVPVLTYVENGFVNGDPSSLLNGSLGTAATSATSVGSYAFTLGSLSAGSNYTLALAAGAPTFVVTPATLTITPSAGQSMTYGSPVPVLAFVPSGFVNGDSLVTGSLGVTATSASPAGSYSFTLGSLSAGLNYQLQLATNLPAFTVTPASPSFTGLSAPVILYGTAATTISGHLQANAGLQLVPAGETVQVTIDGQTESATLASNDSFSVSFPTGTLLPANGPYTIAFSYVGDTNFNAAVPATSPLLVVYVPPAVVTNPTSQTAGSGETITFTAGVRGFPTPSVEWLVAAKGRTNFQPVAGNATASTPTLTLVAQAADNGNQYEAVFTSAGNSVTTKPATLTVSGSVPTVNAGGSPSNQTVAAKKLVTFTAAASASPAPAVQWQISVDGGQTFSNIPGATAVKYTLLVQSADNAYQYRAVFTNRYGVANTTAATLTVPGAPTAPPTVTTQPKAPTTALIAGQRVTLTAAATNGPEVQWQVSTDGVNFTNIAGATATTYSFLAQSSQNGDVYRALFVNPFGKTPSHTVTLAVNPTITHQPASQIIYAGQTATFSATATGNGTPSVQWQVSSNNGKTFTTISTAATLSFTATQAQNGLYYRAVFTSTAGTVTTQTISTIVVLRVLALPKTPVIIAQPASTTVQAGQTASFTATAVATTAPSVQWQVLAKGSTKWVVITTAQNPTANTNTLVLTAAAADNGNLYRAVFTLGKTTATTSAATLTIAVAPTITSSPTTQTVAAGKAVTFQAAATGSPASVQWQVSTDGGLTYTNIAGARSTRYTLIAQAVDDGNLYQAVFTNAVGQKTTEAAALIVG